jgi:hypothetical protein
VIPIKAGAGFVLDSSVSYYPRLLNYTPHFEILKEIRRCGLSRVVTALALTSDSLQDHIVHRYVTALSGQA